MPDRFIAITIDKISTLKNQGHHKQALAAIDDALQLFPDNAELKFEKISLLISAGLYDNIMQSIVDLSSTPLSGKALFDAGCLLAEKGQYADAKAAFTFATAADRSNAWAFNNLGLCNVKLGKLHDAYPAIKSAIDLEPDCAEFHNNIANLCIDLHRHGDAIQHYQKSVELKQDYAKAYSNLGRAYRLCGDQRSLVMIEKALELDPYSRDAVDILLFTSNYSESTPEDIFKLHLKWASRVYSAPQNQIKLPDKSIKAPGSPVHIGYVSADFKNHPVASFFEPLLRNHSSNFKIFCYSNVSAPDAVTKQLTEAGGIWRNIVGLNDVDAAQLVRDDAVDVLVDLSGFTDGHRLGIFALKPAEVQCSWLGYPNTTALPQIDFRISDAIADPPGMTEHLHTETIIRLPRTFICYKPDTYKPVPPPPEGAVTFCSFNNLPKISEQLITMWSDILKSVPDSRLLLKSVSLADPQVCAMLLQRFSRHGIDTARIGLRGFTASKEEHLALYGSCHIALDTFPYHGTTTTCEALWMGVPVVSMAGSSHVSRVGISILTTVGLTELIADNPERYVAIAVELANSPERIAEYRRCLRNMMNVSALVDGSGFATDMEQAFVKMLQKSAEKTMIATTNIKDKQMALSSCDINIGDCSRTFFYRPGTSDEGVIKQIFLQEDYSLARICGRLADLTAYAQLRFSEGLSPLIIDSGANIGASSVYFALKYPLAKIVAIEPGLENFELLTQNSLGLNVDPLNAAVASGNGFVNVIDVGQGFWGLRTEKTADSNAGTVPTVTINDLLKKHEAGYFPFIVKIDIEGGENELFSGNLEWVEKTPCIIIELHDWLMPQEGTSLPFLRCIASQNRDFIHIGENIFSIANNLDQLCRHNNGTALADTFYINLDERTDKNNLFLARNTEAVTCERFSAIDGAMLNPSRLIEHGMINAELDCFGSSALGCAMSHKLIWEYAEQMTRPVTIIEDDAILNCDFSHKRQLLIQQMPADWDIILWGWDFRFALEVQLPGGVTAVMNFEQLINESHISEFQNHPQQHSIIRLAGASGATAYSVSPKGAAKLNKLCFPLKNIDGFDKNLSDIGIGTVMNKLYPELQAFAAFPPLAAKL